MIRETILFLKSSSYLGIIQSIESKNKGRTIYYDSKNDVYYSLDTQHGRFEKLNSKGQHLGEVDMDLNYQEGKLDSSRGHNIKIK